MSAEWGQVGNSLWAACIGGGDVDISIKPTFTGHWVGSLLLKHKTVMTENTPVKCESEQHAMVILCGLFASRLRSIADDVEAAAKEAPTHA